MNQVSFNIKKTVSGDYRTTVTFYEYEDTSPYPGEEEKERLYFCLAEMYSLSVKDMEILNVSTSKTGMTIVIPDALTDYIPRYNHVVEVNDFRLEHKMYNILEFRLNQPDKGQITIVLGNRPYER